MEVSNLRIYPAKLLLFGEHVLLQGAAALSVPVDVFSGKWAWNKEADTHHQQLLQFAQSDAIRSVGVLDQAQFIKEVSLGLSFESNIPFGYGLGSSGALCAAVYDRYRLEEVPDIAILKSIFAQMEHYFHGNSSGIDPLTSFMDAPVLIRNKTLVERATAAKWLNEAPVVFLLDSNLPRKTGPLVEWFLDQCKTSPFSKMLSEQYLPAHSNLIEAWLSADAESFWPNLRQISSLQLENFVPMIPASLRDFWEKNIDNQTFTLKICGAGGGGFVLGFAKNIETVASLSSTFRIVLPLK